MNCKKVIIELSSYLDGVLDPAIKLELEQHLGRCEDCRLVVDTTRLAISVRHFSGVASCGGIYGGRIPRRLTAYS